MILAFDKFSPDENLQPDDERSTCSSVPDRTAGLWEGRAGSGAASPIVILHGLFGSKRNWRGIARELCRLCQADVYTVDLRHHGDSPNEGVFSVEALASDVIRFIQSVTGGPVALIGHSLGGKTALKAALIEPRLVRALVLVDITPFDLPSFLCNDLNRVVNALGALPLARVQHRGKAEELLLKDIPDIGLVRFLLQNLVRTASDAVHDSQGGPPVDTGPAYRWRIGLDAIRGNFHDVCRGVLQRSGRPETISKPGSETGPEIISKPGSETGPEIGSEVGPVSAISCFCLRGGGSPYFPVGDAEALRGIFPRLEIQTVPGAGHWIHAEQPQQFIAAVTDFLGRCGFSS